MRIDCFVNGGQDTTRDATGVAVSAEAAGVDGVWIGEVNTDPFLPLAGVAAATGRVSIGTGIATAFSRSPMSVAQVAHDLQRLSGGRFVLGLGSQVRAHVERRFGMPFDRPVTRMREYVEAVRAVWRCWDDGEALDYQGEIYRLTLMTPMFHPPANPHGPPRIFLSAVGPQMTALAGRLADGLVAHGFTTPTYLREVTLPALGADRRPGFEVMAPVFVASGRDEEATRAAAERYRATIGFYGSTPAYRRVLAHHGWDDLGEELSALVRQGRWSDLAAAVPDDVLEAFTTIATLDDLPRALHHRFGGVLDRVALSLPDGLTGEERAETITRLRAG